MAIFVSTEELIDSFGDIHNNGFYDPVNLTDTPIGFSVKKNYPPNIRFKPAIGQRTGLPDSIAAIWVVYTPPSEKENIAGSSKAPIRFRVATMSKYRVSHFDYNYQDIDGDCPSKESLEGSLASPQPIDLNFEDVYFYDHINHTFIDDNGNSLTGVEVLEQVFETHCKTVHILWGLKIRLKLAWQAKFSGVLTLIVEALTTILKQLFGRTIESNVMMAGIYEPYKRVAFKKLDEDSIEILGYKASKHVVIMFCIIVILASVYRYYFSVGYDYFSSLEGQEFLTLTHAIFAIWFIDVVIPEILFFGINMVLRLKKKVIFMRFET